VLYASFKYGNSEGWIGGRFYNSYDEPSLSDLIGEHSSLVLLDCWQTKAVRHNRENEAWLNVLVRKL
jgi:hypothetical protein